MQPYWARPRVTYCDGIFPVSIIWKCYFYYFLLSFIKFWRRHVLIHFFVSVLTKYQTENWKTRTLVDILLNLKCFPSLKALKRIFILEQTTFLGLRLPAWRSNKVIYFWKKHLYNNPNSFIRCKWITNKSNAYSIILAYVSIKIRQLPTNWNALIYFKGL